MCTMSLQLHVHVYHDILGLQPRSQAPPQLVVAYCRILYSKRQKAREEPGNEAKTLQKITLKLAWFGLRQ